MQRTARVPHWSFIGVIGLIVGDRFITSTLIGLILMSSDVKRLRVIVNLPVADHDESMQVTSASESERRMHVYACVYIPIERIPTTGVNLIAIRTDDSSSCGRPRPTTLYELFRHRRHLSFLFSLSLSRFFHSRLPLPVQFNPHFTPKGKDIDDDYDDNNVYPRIAAYRGEDSQCSGQLRLPRTEIIVGLTVLLRRRTNATDRRASASLVRPNNGKYRYRGY